MISTIVDAAKDGFITLKVRVCDVCGDYPKQDHNPDAWPRWSTDGMELVKCTQCGRVVCHACLRDWCCELDEE